MLKLRRFLEGFKKYLFLGPFFKLLEAIFELIVPMVMSKIIDTGIGNHDKPYIMKMCGVIIMLGVFGLIFALTCQYFAAKCAFGFGTALREALYKHINKLSHSEIDRIGTSSLSTRLINDTTMVQQGVNMFIRLAVRVPFLVIGATVLAMSMNLKLSKIFLISAPIILLVLYLVMSRTVPMYKTTQKKLDVVSRLTRENLEGVRVIRAFSRQEQEKEKFRQASDDLCENAILVGKISTILNPATFMIMNLSIVTIIWFGGVKINTGSLTQGELTAFIQYMTQILLALIVLANLVTIFTKAQASATRINEIFETESSIKGGEIKNIDESAENAIEFKNATFKYNGSGDTTLSNISFNLEKGKTLGIIGGTGSGKSTLASLIMRFYDVNDGEVKLFGKNIKEYDLEALRQMIGDVPQKATLFSGTILENMRWAKQDATEEEVIKALKIAQAWEFVSKLPDTINTKISQGGKNLSGGQKQRLTIARALVGSPEIVILDDSMSALDYATDYALRKAISENLKDTTVIMISQRTTSIKHADKIIVMDDGKIADTGTHDQLYNDCQIYREICEIQNKGA